MNELYDQALANIESTAHLLASRVPFKDGFNFRHIGESLHQELVQILARLLSTRHSARLLKEHGFVQVQVSLQRRLHEMQYS
jgi:hypothetical protein